MKNPTCPICRKCSGFHESETDICIDNMASCKNFMRMTQRIPLLENLIAKKVGFAKSFEFMHMNDPLTVRDDIAFIIHFIRKVTDTRMKCILSRIYIEYILRYIEYFKQNIFFFQNFTQKFETLSARRDFIEISHEFDIDLEIWRNEIQIHSQFPLVD